jgi:hypothetical protein
MEVSKMRIQRKHILLTVFIAVLFLAPVWLYAKRRVIYDAGIENHNGCAVIHIGFNFPVRYKRHFPSEMGDELRIQIDPITIGLSDSENQFEREQVWFSQDDIVPLSEVIFEGDIAGGPFLTLTFQRSIAFEVEQGDDFRSLLITLFQDEERAECFPFD